MSSYSTDIDTQTVATGIILLDDALQARWRTGTSQVNKFLKQLAIVVLTKCDSNME